MPVSPAESISELQVPFETLSQIVGWRGWEDVSAVKGAYCSSCGEPSFHFQHLHRGSHYRGVSTFFWSPWLLHPRDGHTLAQAYIHTHKIKKKKTRWDITGKHRVLTSGFRVCVHTHAKHLHVTCMPQKKKKMTIKFSSALTFNKI